MKESMMDLNLAAMENVNGGEYDGPIYMTEEGYFYVTDDGPRYETAAAVKAAMERAERLDEYFEEEYRGGPYDLGGLFISKTRKNPRVKPQE